MHPNLLGHSPLPWKDNNYGQIEAANGKIVATFFGDNSIPLSESIENGKHLVRAANNYGQVSKVALENDAMRIEVNAWAADTARAYLRLTELRDAAKALMDRCELTQGQAFYDCVKPEWIAMELALGRECVTPFGVWKYDRNGEPIK